MSLQRVLVGDDHAVTRRGVREILRDAFGELEICEVPDADALLAEVKARPWDLILLDIMMPGPNILDVLTSIRATNATVPILILTAVSEIEYVIQTMKAGANGVIHKHHAPDDLQKAIETVIAGGAYLHPETAAAVARAVRDAGASMPHEKLSDRELEIFRLIAVGRAIKEIAGDLSLSHKTVATHFARIKEKTGLPNFVEIARYAIRNGLVK